MRILPTTDFFSSEAGQFAGLAKAFMEGARTLDEAQPEKGRILFRPTLALAGHGLELMFKACICLNGIRPPTKGRDGHNIGKLWPLEVCEPLRRHVIVNAGLFVETERARGVYPDVPEDAETAPLLEEYVKALAVLHAESGYPLRYPASPDRMAPRTPLLVGSLWRTADDFVKRPNDFALSGFRELVRAKCI